MAKKNLKLERIVFGTDRRSAKKLRRSFAKVLAKDKKSDGLSLSYQYHPFRKKADYTIEGHPKTISKCVRTFEKFVKKQDKLAERMQKQKRLKKLKPISKGKYYTMKSTKERRYRV